MRVYCIAMMVMAGIGMTISCIKIADSTYELYAPEVNISGRDYDQYINLEYYKEKQNEKDRDCPCLKKEILTEEQLEKKWETFRTITISSIKHNARSSFFGEFASMFIFSSILGLHFVLIKKYQTA